MQEEIKILQMPIGRQCIRNPIINQNTIVVYCIEEKQGNDIEFICIALHLGRR